MSFDEIRREVARYYGDTLAAHGPTPRGVDWRDEDSQRLRFDQLLKLDPADGSRLLDYGCGYGALADHLAARGRRLVYCGYDFSGPMIERARDLHAGWPDCRFVGEEGELEPADYAVASGIFNVKLSREDAEWSRYVLATLDRLADLGRRGFAFNVLSLHSDPERRRPELHYADPLALFAHCQRYSRHVALLHDYPLWEFTLLVRRPPPG